MLNNLLSIVAQELEVSTSTLWMRSILVIFSDVEEEMRTKYQLYEYLLERYHISHPGIPLALSSLEGYLHICIEVGLLVELKPGVYMRTQEGRIYGNELHRQINAEK